MSLWDGLLKMKGQILIVGATNRPESLDEAVLRRLPKRFSVPLPDSAAREEILRIWLKGTEVSPALHASEGAGVLY